MTGIFGSYGKPRADLEIRIFGSDDREVAPGRQGESAVRPRVVDVILFGYYKKPEQMLEAGRNF